MAIGTERLPSRRALVTTGASTRRQCKRQTTPNPNDTSRLTAIVGAAASAPVDRNDNSIVRHLRRSLVNL